MLTVATQVPGTGSGSVALPLGYWERRSPSRLHWKYMEVSVDLQEAMEATDIYEDLGCVYQLYRSYSSRGCLAQIPIANLVFADAF
jgi:hypothetical protein